MAYWSGVVFFLAGAWLLWSAMVRRSRAQAALARGETPMALHPSLALMAEIGPPIITFGLVIAAGQVMLAYFATGGAGFAPTDLAGFLFLLLAYGIWVKTRTRYRPMVMVR